MEKTLRVAVLGGGTIGRLLLQKAGGLPGVRIVGVAGRGPQSRGASLAREFDVPYAHDMDGLLEGIALFNRGEFWDAHEAWEGVWAGLPKGSDERRFYQGLIQLAAAFLHRERARATPERSARAALRCYRSGMAKLDGLADVTFGVDLAALRREAAGCFEALEAGAPEAEWPPAPRIARGGA